MAEQAQEQTASGELMRVALRLFDDRERWHLSQVMMQAAQRGGIQVVETSASDADVVFLNPDEPGADLFLRAQQKARRPVAVTYGESPTETIFHLPKPAQSRLLIPLLQELDQVLMSIPTTRAADEGDEVASALQPVPAGDLHRLCDYISRATLAKKPLQADAPVGALHIDPGNNKAWLPPGMDLQSLTSFREAFSQARDDQFQWVAPAQLSASLQDGELTSVDLHEFTWTLSQLSSPEETDQGDIMETPVRLLRWPNFARLEHSHIHLKWAGLLMRSPLTLSQLVRYSDGGFVPVARFYNACLMGGLLKPETGALQQPARKKGSGNRSGVFKRILDKLGAA
jgi:hypothetical protein